MDECERESDGDGCEPRGRSLVGYPKDHEQKEQGHHDFGDERRRQRVAAGRMCSITI